MGIIRSVDVKLTSLAHGAGCGCKLPAEEVQRLVGKLPLAEDPNLLVDATTSDDAAVYRVRDDLAIVQTIDFFTPIVDDPYDFGRIAAANAMSDIWAMGAEPMIALNMIAFPLETLGGVVFEEILRGGHEAAQAAGVIVVGGHSIDDAEPKYGMAVTGTVAPDDLITNAGGRPGDVLVLSKPLGAAVAATASKRGLDPYGDVIGQATAVMAELNRDAAAAARAAGAHALTDVTGYGLLGHLHELAAASGVAAQIDAAAVPAITGVLELLAGDGHVVASGTRRNREWAERFTTFADDVGEPMRWLTCDAMTSGGLLAAVPPGSEGAAMGVVVGVLVEGEPGTIAVD